MGWRSTDLSEDEAYQQAANLNLIFSQYGQRTEADRVEVQAPMEVESATWTVAWTLDCWVKEEHEWWGRVRGSDGRQVWIRASDLRRPAARSAGSRVRGWTMTQHGTRTHLAQRIDPCRHSSQPNQPWRQL
jgi:hypothetical protein